MSQFSRQQRTDNDDLGAPPDAEDFAAILSLARSSPDSLGSLLDEYRGRLERLAAADLCSELRPKIGASDLVQQTLLEAAEGFSQFRGDSRHQFAAWIERILMRNLLNEIRRWRSTQKRSVDRELSLDRSGAMRLASADKTPSSLARKREREALLHQAIERLPADQQQVIRLRHFEQLGFEEIGRRMDRRYSAARMLWYRAFERLMREMGGSREPPG